MKKSTLYKWLLAAGLWIGCCALSIWNANQITTLLSLRDRDETTNVEAAFYKRHSERIENVIASRDHYFSITRETRIARLAFEDRILAMANTHGLKQMSISSNLLQKTDRNIPMEASFIGTFDALLHWSGDLVREFPHVNIRILKALVGTDIDKTRFTLKMDYRYRLLPPNKKRLLQS